MDSRKIVVIPTYNEAENIEILMKEIFAVVPDINILVVDDNSPDGTSEIVKRISESDTRVLLKKREGKLGLGTAYIAGFKESLSRGYDVIMQMDCDFSHQPRYLLDFLNAIKQADLVLATRYREGGGTENWTFLRKLTSRGGNFYARTMLGMRFSDLTGGFKCWRKEALEAINIETVKSEGYAFQIETTYRAFRKGFRISEVPIVFPDRSKGKSKFSRKIMFEAFFRVMKMRFEKF
jgi:dolichol-phosphate mannosyltransferase